MWRPRGRRVGVGLDVTVIDGRLELEADEALAVLDLAHPVAEALLEVLDVLLGDVEAVGDDDHATTTEPRPQIAGCRFVTR